MLEQFKDKINPTEGTISIKISKHNLFEPTVTPITVSRIVVGDTEFLLQREPNMMLVFQHISPNTGTRVSRLDMTKVPKAEQHQIIFAWSSKEVRIYMGVPNQGEPVQGDYKKLT